MTDSATKKKYHSPCPILDPAAAAAKSNIKPIAHSAPMLPLSIDTMFSTSPQAHELAESQLDKIDLAPVRPATLETMSSASSGFSLPAASQSDIDDSAEMLLLSPRSITDEQKPSRKRKFEEKLPGIMFSAKVLVWPQTYLLKKNRAELKQNYEERVKYKYQHIGYKKLKIKQEALSRSSRLSVSDDSTLTDIISIADKLDGYKGDSPSSVGDSTLTDLESASMHMSDDDGDNGGIMVDHLATTTNVADIGNDNATAADTNKSYENAEHLGSIVIEILDSDEEEASTQRLSQ